MQQITTPQPTIPARSIVGNVSWMMVARIVSISAAILTIPPRVSLMGLERYGVMGLAWAVIGYLSLLDLGMERAVNQAIASRQNSERRDEVANVFWSALAVLTVMGIIAAVIGVAISGTLVERVFEVPDSLHRETTIAFWLLALTLPFQMAASGFTGALESHHRFDLVSLATIFFSFMTYVAPILVLLVTDNLIAIASVALAGRVLTTVIVAIMAWRVFPAMRTPTNVSGAVLRSLAKTGGWMNAVALLHPLMTTIDRMIIGAVVSLTAVSFYSVPYDSATRLWVLPLTIAGVLFPIFSDAWARDDRKRVALFVRGMKASFLSVLPISLGLAILAWPVLNIWIGADIANGGGRVLQILAIGICANAFGHVPFVMIQGAARSDLIAKLQLAELPVYVAGVVLSANVWGIEGIACVWMVRNVVDSLGLYVLSLPFVGERVMPLDGRFLALCAAAFAGALALYRAGLPIQLAYAGVAIGGLLVIAWIGVLDAQDRELVKRQSVRLQGLPLVRRMPLVHR